MSICNALKINFLKYKKLLEFMGLLDSQRLCDLYVWINWENDM